MTELHQTEPCFSHRSCYVNFAVHLQNAWNVNVLYPGAPNEWAADDWRRFLGMIKAFGLNCFEYWVVPTLNSPRALQNDGIYRAFADTVRLINSVAHSIGIRTKLILAPNTIGPEWYSACPNDPEDKQMILSGWRHWMRELAGTDIVGIFPGDPGGCNRNGCDHRTFIELALELTDIAIQENPQVQMEIGTWGTPFSGWGADLRSVPNWDGTWDMIIDEKFATPEVPCHIWNGGRDRSRQAMEYFVGRLSEFPDDAMVAINLGFSPDGDDTMGGDAREYAREIAKTRSITTWDYSLAEGELINYPHWRLPRIAQRRREERAAAPYVGGMSYTMTPKLNLLSMYAAGRLFADPDADPDMISREFCVQVFGESGAEIGELFEAFEVVNGWGHYPRAAWTKDELRQRYARMIDLLEAADTSACALPLYPDPETYRQDLLWFAHRFHEMAGSDPDRERIRKEYWRKALAIYDVIPMSADKRAELAARSFSEILLSRSASQ